MNNQVLKIKNLTFSYKNKQLLYDKFNLQLNRGELISIVGKSGSGKSTLFELITNNLKPLSGTIEVKKISTIYQDPYSSFHQTYTILNQIKDVANLDNIDVLLKELNLTKDLLNKKPSNLSGGQLQRCSILRAILMKPDIILADEPTSALDNVVALDVMKLLLKFLPTVGILLITHDETMASWCSDKIIRIDDEL